jgi:dUTP pyrophosphatase
LLTAGRTGRLAVARSPIDVRRAQNGMTTMSEQSEPLCAQYCLKTDTAKAPEYKSERAAGMDFFASETITINPGEHALVKTGIVMRLPAGYYLEISARSSTFRKKRLILTNGIGIIDEDYCGIDDEIMFSYLNMGNEQVTIHAGEAIGQGVVKHRLRAELRHFTPDQRSRGGFGSTGGYR